MTTDICNVQLYDAHNVDFPVVYSAMFLDTRYKRNQLKELRKEIASNRVDKQMIPYIDRLNAIKGVCTQFCCMGHVSRRKKYSYHSGNLLFYVDAFTHRALINNWHIIRKWPECIEIGTGHHYSMMRWMFHWRVTKRKSYYKEFLNNLIPNLKKWRRAEIKAWKEHKKGMALIYEVQPDKFQ